MVHFFFLLFLNGHNVHKSFYPTMPKSPKFVDYYQFICELCLVWPCLSALFRGPNNDSKWRVLWNFRLLHFIIWGGKTGQWVCQEEKRGRGENCQTTSRGVLYVITYKLITNSILIEWSQIKANVKNMLSSSTFLQIIENRIPPLDSKVWKP